MKLCTAQQMRDIDTATIKRFGIPGLVLMENAGLRVLEAVQEVAQRNSRIRILCGRGNNGGDGLVVARHLYNRGSDVQVVLLAEAVSVQGDAQVNFAIARRMGVPIIEAPSTRLLNRIAAEADILVDGILGIGAVGTVRGPALMAIRATHQCAGHIIAIDIPSGISADSGAVLGEAVKANVTVTFGLPKIGLYTYPGRAYCGEIRVADIGIPRSLLEDPQLPTNLTTATEAAAMLPPRPPDVHKGNCGRVVILGGSPGLTGAPTLAALGALRAGAGLVTVGCAKNLNSILEMKLTEAMTRPLPDTLSGVLSERALEPALQLCEGADAVVIGPGLSRESEPLAFTRQFLARCAKPVVIDADALFALTPRSPCCRPKGAPTIITPHPGEMARLCETSIPEIQADRLGYARALASTANAIVVLKGASTVIAVPSGEAWINPSGSDALASGGTGDVLAGIMGAFLAGGSSPVAAAVASVYYHGVAGEVAKSRGCSRAVLASDVADTLLAVLP
ncbi:MAG: NAD(P)H-hydrate dehydratase [Candidatus Zipacnadales bacterium]